MTLAVFNTVADLRTALRSHRQAGKMIGFIPTMGNLHAGHQQLIRVARQQCDTVVASIFVNPTQFGAGEDFDTYPRTLAADQDKLAEAGCDLLFAPAVADIYPNPAERMRTRVQVSGVSELLCGASRPGHFDGVATVVTKLFHIVQPDRAFFGEKDYQQLAVIRQMVNDLLMPVEIIGVPTVRADDGLALSSRNGYLSGPERQLAPVIQQALQQASRQLQQLPVLNPSDLAAIQQQGRERLMQQGLSVDYFEILGTDLTMPAAGAKQLVILTAARLGTTRLIDNLTVMLGHSPSESRQPVQHRIIAP